MRVSQPRVRPLPESEWNDDAREFMGRVERDGHVLNIYKTLARHPKLLKRWGVFGTHGLYKSTLPARERELLILRTGWLCGWATPAPSSSAPPAPPRRRRRRWPPIVDSPADIGAVTEGVLDERGLD